MSGAVKTEHNNPTPANKLSFLKQIKTKCLERKNRAFLYLTISDGNPAGKFYRIWNYLFRIRQKGNKSFGKLQKVLSLSLNLDLSQQNLGSGSDLF